MQKIKPNPKPLATNSQKGVTLLVAIIMLAAVTFVSFALSAIVLRELVAARLLLRSEPAISGANAGGEIGTYQLLRETGSLTASGNLVQSGARYSVSPDLFDYPYLFTIPSGGEGRIALFDPVDPMSPAANYGSVTMINDPPGTSVTLRVEIFSFGNDTTPVCTFTLAPGQTSPTCSLNSFGDDRYGIIIRPATTGAASGQILTTDNAGADKGVPSIAPKLEVTGSNGQVERTIRIDFSTQ